MTNYELYEILGDIDERRVKEAREYRKAKKTIWLKWGPLAACLCLVAVGTFVTIRFWAESLRSQMIFREQTLHSGEMIARPDGKMERPIRRMVLREQTRIRIIHLCRKVK